jgi:hypothetical protein
VIVLSELASGELFPGLSTVFFRLFGIKTRPLPTGFVWLGLHSKPCP